MLEKGNRETEGEGNQEEAGIFPESHGWTLLTLVGAIQKAKPYKKENSRYKNITHKLATFTAGNVMNCIVECEEFGTFLSQLNPWYPMSSQAALDRKLFKLMDVKGKVAAKLHDTRNVAI